VTVAGERRDALASGWQAAAARPDEEVGIGELDALAWIPADVPGTAAGALAAAGRWSASEPHPFDNEDWWFRTSFAADPDEGEGEASLLLDGIATVAEVYLNGEPVLASDSMFHSHALDVGSRLQPENELAIRCRALTPLLAEARKPRARWRTRLVPERNLRFFRTMLLASRPGPPRSARGALCASTATGVWSSTRSPCARARSPPTASCR